MTSDADPWSARVRDALARYDEPLVRLVAGKLVKAKIGQVADELVEKAAETQTNAPVIDRRIRDLSEPARACTRIPTGHPEGYLEAFATVYCGVVRAIRRARKKSTTAASISSRTNGGFHAA